MRHQRLKATKYKLIGKDLGNFLKTFIFAVIIGAGVGAYAALFGLLIYFLTDLRQANGWLLLLLPVAGLLIMASYLAFKVYEPKGTNRVLRSISENEKLPPIMIPLITLGTALTHLCGGSAGREGAALQIGGAMGYWFGRAIKQDRKTLKILTMCGMSAAFAALMGTPITAMVFALEVISIGIMQYSALVPCAISSVIGFEIAKLIGLQHESFTFITMPDFNWLTSLESVGFGVLCAAASIVFCVVLHKTEELFHKYLTNPYVGISFGGLIVVAFSVFLGTTDYNGVGSDIIASALSGDVVWYAFLAKIFLTAITLGAGYKGGEIIPTVFIGATFGCTVGPLLGLSPEVGAALGVCGLFCGVTNCPISSLILCFEFFGFQGIPYFMIVCAISYRLSGYFSLYQGQKIIYSKSNLTYINRGSLKK